MDLRRVTMHFHSPEQISPYRERLLQIAREVIEQHQEQSQEQD
jgi:hypothetical protein